MKDQLEEFIRRNQASFDDKEPSDKGWGRIESQLQFKSGSSMWDSVRIWRAAAILLFGLSACLLIPRDLFTTNTNVSLKEFNEVEAYYKNEIFRKVKLIEEISTDDQDNKFSQDLYQLDAMYQVLKEEMKHRPSKKVKDALVLNLMVRINLLNQQLQHLEKEESESAEKESGSI